MSYTVYPTKMKSIKSMYKSFETEKEADDYITSRKNPENYTKEETVSETKVKTKIKASVSKTSGTNTRKDILKTVNWDKAVEITPENRKQFYGKKGYIKIVDNKGECLHQGITTNMGKIYSNFYNCEKYNQSYEFDLKSGKHKLLFKEM